MQQKMEMAMRQCFVARAPGDSSLSQDIDKKF